MDHGRCLLLSLVVLAAATAQAPAQDEAAEPPRPRVLSPNSEVMTPEAIDQDYNHQLLGLERQRLDRLAKAASRQPPKDAAATYEKLFRLAIVNNLFRDAEPIADQILRSPGGSPNVRFLAHTVDLIATADRGAYDESLTTLRNIVGETKNTGRATPSALDSTLLLALCEAYYQRLVQGNQLEVARRAFEILAKESVNPAVKGYCTDRLRQLELVGKPAPSFQGADLDGKPASLAGFKGKVVLLDFWASWCVPSVEELAWLEEVYSANSPRGFQIVGVNLDTAAEGATRASVAPNVMRFVLDHNVRWPVLLNGEGGDDLAKIYGIKEIPSNILIGRDGKVIHLDLTRRNLAEVVARACAP